ncbi:MAG: hypothetical protein MST08_17765 [Parabacteroides distasonis]|nr:hypothetical protein [Parabacteroides distasonis]
MARISSRSEFISEELSPALLKHPFLTMPFSGTNLLASILCPVESVILFRLNVTTHLMGTFLVINSPSFLLFSISNVMLLFISMIKTCCV